jgi:hypothetical protein
MADMWNVAEIEKEIKAEYAAKVFETVPRKAKESFWFVSIRISSEEV